MKKLMIIAAALAVFFVPSSALAHAGEYSYYAPDPTIAVTGVATSTGLIDARELESVTFLTEATTTDHALVINCLAADKSTVLFSFPSLTVTQGQKFMTQFRMDTTVPATPPTNALIYNIPPCPYMNGTMAAANDTAKITIEGRRQQTGGQTVKYSYESGSVTAGAALSTGVIDMRRAEVLTVIAEATTTNRTLVVSCTDAAGTSLYDYPSLTVTAAAKFMRVFRGDSMVPGTEVTNVLHLPVMPCRYMKASIAAAGAASAKLAAYAR